MVISSPGVYMSLASCIPQIQVGLPAEFSIKWSKHLLCYLKIEGRLTKHTGSVEPGRKIKKGITLGDAGQTLTLYNLVKQRDEFRYLCSNFWQVRHSWFCGKMVVTTFKTIWGNGTRRIEQGNKTKLKMKSASFLDDGHQINSISQWQRLYTIGP